MTAQRPEFLAEREIRDAMERGEFDDLEGAGKPFPGLDGNYDPAWWAKAWVRRARAQDVAWDLRRRIRKELLRPDDEECRMRIAELNTEIDAVNTHLPREERLRKISPTS